MQYADPADIACPYCDESSVHRVDDLLDLRVKCPDCGASFKNIGLGMRTALDEWHLQMTVVAIICGLEYVLGSEIGDDVIESVATLSDLINTIDLHLEKIGKPNDSITMYVQTIARLDREKGWWYPRKEIHSEAAVQDPEEFDVDLPILDALYPDRWEPSEVTYDTRPPNMRPRPMNQIIAIHPYRHEGLWVFDDPKVDLLQEPFVSGADTIIDDMVTEIPGAEAGFTILFSADPFPGYQACFEWRREEMGGNWYYSPDLGREGWLCPALFRYFAAAPEKIYAQFKPKAG